MKTVMANSSQDVSSKRHFHWTKKVSNEDEVPPPPTSRSSSTTAGEEEEKENENFKVLMPEPSSTASAPAALLRKKLQAIAISRFRSVLTTLGGKYRSNPPHGLGPRVIGTLFGHRRGHVHFVFQKDPNSEPAFLIELATPISGLVREMASGLVRIALECDKDEEKKARKLLEESQWRTYCNGKKCGFATRRECGPKEWKVLKAVEPISMGAGVLPGNGNGNGNGDRDGDEDGDKSDCEIMYMRAKFERVVGSRDSEAFYMMNPDSNGAPELSLYLLRV